MADPDDVAVKIHHHKRESAATAEQMVESWLAGFNAALQDGDAAAVAGMFAPLSFWRDVVALSWNIVTVEGREGVEDMLRHTLASARPRAFEVTEPPADTGETIDAWLSFETETGRGSAYLRLKDGEAFTLLTSLRELKGYEERRDANRPLGTTHGSDSQRQSWPALRRAEAEQLGYSTQPEVLIVGGGQSGLALGARLRLLEVPAIVIDRHPRPGDQWRSRYESLCLHDPVWYDHMPYLKFPGNWPVFSPKDKIGEWLEMYARVMELNYWGFALARSASYDETAGRWDVLVEREGQAVDLRPGQLVLATGISGMPSLPDLPGHDLFKGEQQHSSEFRSAGRYAGKRVVVVGSNNSAFDICVALYEAGSQVTMVQRSASTVVRSESVMRYSFETLYSEQALAAGITTERADMLAASIPYRLAPEVQKPIYDRIRDADRAYYERLGASGFWYDFGSDETGLALKYLRRGSGYYIDVGGAQLICDGHIALAHGQVDHLTEDAIVLADGTVLPASLIVYATGYRSMDSMVAELISPHVAERVGKVWGLGSGTEGDPGPWEGELRNMWKPTQQPGLWFHGGNLALSRHYSLALALQLKARVAGIDTPVYALAKAHRRPLAARPESAGAC